ncbi:MAG: molybdopterin-dependent oxidoreductase [Candidatus Bathyarchaeia archaeon]
MKSVTCPVCGCLCDDLEVTIEDNKVIGVRNACAVSEAKFLNYGKHRLYTPQVRKNGRLVSVSWDEALQKAAEILANASYPILYGWSSTSCEANRVGLELAEEVGGVMDNTSTVCHGPSILSVQDVGLASCTLGQLRHRADLVVYWACDPWSAHPRHIERYTSFSEGRFRPSIWLSYLKRVRAQQIRKRVRRALDFASKSTQSMWLEAQTVSSMLTTETSRKMIVVDVRKTRTADAADLFLQIQPNTDYEILQALRMLVKDEDMDLDTVAGVPVETLERVADLMINCNLGVLFFGVGLTMSLGKLRNVDAALNLVRDLNRRTKFLIMPMRGHYNVTGANVVSTWQTGYPYAVDFSHGYPRYNPGETSVVDILARRESDAALVVASDPVSNFPSKAVQHLVSTPLIVIDPVETPTSVVADVVLPSTFVGIETEGEAYRMDYVPITLKRVVEPPEGLLSDYEIICEILNRVRRLKKMEKI